MTTREITLELEDILKRLRRLRRRNTHAQWFCHGVRSAESLLAALVKCVDHVTKMTK